MRVSERIGGWVRALGIGSGRQRRRGGRVSRVRVRRRGQTSRRGGIAAYRRVAKWGERVSRFVQEAVKVPAYEARALSGERSPDRFRWRGRWYRVVEVAASWRDGRRRALDRPEYGRIYYNVMTEPMGFFQLYYERSAPGRKGGGRWMLYRRTEIRPARR